MDPKEFPLGGFNKLIGLRLEEATPERVVATVPVTADLHQPYGLVHGGVYSTVVEATASIGAALWLGDRGRTVGIGNQTEFLRPVRDGVLHIVATPIKRGRSTQLWQVEVTDHHGHLAAHGRVRLMNLGTAAE
jgi:1,4-dihydroxy-2-naphthoyl-CoA hydrolase